MAQRTEIKMISKKSDKKGQKSCSKEETDLYVSNEININIYVYIQ